ncbi:hypothetical protein L1D16_14280 [Vibrio sp. Isolate31]|uniref:hypothetical protein n=1 Tax=unclassified Vibrio TaxID=2614977 RepID=UPI001EFD9F19|nr:MULTISPECIES: hypothetical protein [unclassified Vibrio]MCG9555351.1 hypothetical protein [Vibrio sp. Isolate32]MCG9602017.1 hypothetical protein [Vibrio sp. Isolate31]
MYKRTVLAFSLSLALTACGGSDSPSSPTTPDTPSSQTTPDTPHTKVTALDGYLNKAYIYKGLGCETFLGETNEHGEFLASSYQDVAGPLCVKTIPQMTQDMSRGVVTEAFTLRANNSSVVSPFTDFVEIAVENGLERDQALLELKSHLGAIEVKESLLLGDYLQQTNDVADALLVIGEALIDNHEYTYSQKQQLIAGISETISDLVLDNNVDFLPSTAPHITLNNNGEVLVDPVLNYRPAISEESNIASITTLLGDEFHEIDLSNLFSDPDDDSADLIYTVELLEHNGTNGLEITQGYMLTGTPASTGRYSVLVYAQDSKGAKSYPIQFDWEVRDRQANAIPVVREESLTALNLLLEGQHFSVNETIDFTYDVNELFGDDDGDLLSFRVSTGTLDPNLVANIRNKILTIKGVPANAGAQTISIVANDSFDDSLPALVGFSISETLVNKPPVVVPHKVTQLKKWFARLSLQKGEYTLANTNIEDLFIDEDLSQVWVTSSEHKGLEISSSQGELTVKGAPSSKGVFVVTLAAEDRVGSRSDLSFDVNVKKAVDLKPVLNPSVDSLVTQEISNWVIKQGSYFVDSVDLNNLFIDPEGTPVTYKASTQVEGLSITIDSSKQLRIEGTPSEVNAIGPRSIFISANDSLYGSNVLRWVDERYEFNLLEADKPLPELEDIGKIDATEWFDNDVFYAVAYMDAFDDGIVYVPPSYTCLAYQFADGVYSIYMPRSGSKYCEENLANSVYTEVGTYSFIDGEVHIEYPYMGLGAEEVWTLRAKNEESDSAMATQHLLSNVNYFDTATIYKTAQQANNRIAKQESSIFESFVADPENKGYVKGEIHVSKVVEGEKVAVSFEVVGESSYLDCSFMAYYKPFTLVANGQESDPITEYCESTDDSAITYTVEYSNSLAGEEVYLFAPALDIASPYLETLGAVIPN